MKEQDIKTIVNAIIGRFDDIEEETGADFTFAKRVILRYEKVMLEKLANS